MGVPGWDELSLIRLGFGDEGADIEPPRSLGELWETPLLSALPVGLVQETPLADDDEGLKMDEKGTALFLLELLPLMPLLYLFFWREGVEGGESDRYDMLYCVATSGARLLAE